MEVKMILDALRQRNTVMNVQEVSELLGLSKSLLYRMAAANEIPTIRLSGAVRFDPGQLAAWYEARLNPLGRKSVSAEKFRSARASLTAESA
jgi:excisionase family DNA binding protein